MNHTEKFNETVGILVKAYLNDTLEATDCAKCAVGNLVAAANTYSPLNHFWLDPKGNIIEAEWQEVIWAERDQDPTFQPTPAGYKQIESTGYNVVQFGRIEAAFMDGIHTPIGDGRPNNYNGLMAVVDVLADIHGIDLSTATAAKALFVK